MAVDVWAVDWDSDDQESPLIVGGNEAFVAQWPVNPDGDHLLHLFSINCYRLKELAGLENIPQSGFISVFSTYTQDYFLDNICYSGDALEYELITSGYTLVSFQEEESKCQSPVAEFIPEKHPCLRKREVEEGSFPLFSFFADSAANGLKGVEGLYNEYDFVCQFGSSSFPAPYEDVFYLHEAVGYLFVKKGLVESPDKKLQSGLFFVQTA